MKLILTIWLFSQGLINFCFYDNNDSLIVNKLITTTFIYTEIYDNVYESVTCTTTEGCVSTFESAEGYYIIVTDEHNSYYLVIPPGYEYYDINLDCYD